MTTTGTTTRKPNEHSPRECAALADPVISSYSLSDTNPWVVAMGSMVCTLCARLSAEDQS